MEITNKQLLEEIIRCNKDLKATIEAVEVRVTLKIEEIKHRLEKVEKENQELQTKIESLDRANRKNNIIIFGLEREKTEDLNSGEIIELLKNLSDINIVEADLNNFYRLGKTSKSPVKIEFISYLKKSLVLKNCKKLKGTRIHIADDLTLTQREEGKILRKHLFLAEENQEIDCYIKNNKLYVNKKSFTAADLEATHGDYYTNQNKPHSAPGTPVAKENPPVFQKPNSQNIEKTQDIPSTKSAVPKKTPKDTIIEKPNTRKNSASKY
ncbi:unnamed protein product [Phaedon cochleariae]|uniref:Endonuclease-reverse transcriptase n=1 Tax=Phaedon cochleariae TaxID=80249 RepID=A0A9N9X6A7_PHACE|nr:unnamed protein product [Phaedon cochleariae]